MHELADQFMMALYCLSVLSGSSQYHVYSPTFPPDGTIFGGDASLSVRGEALRSAEQSAPMLLNGRADASWRLVLNGRAHAEPTGLAEDVQYDLVSDEQQVGLDCFIELRGE
jgi:hypothetical protein